MSGTTTASRPNRPTTPATSASPTGPSSRHQTPAATTIAAVTSSSPAPSRRCAGSRSRAVEPTRRTMPPSRCPVPTQAERGAHGRSRRTRRRCCRTCACGDRGRAAGRPPRGADVGALERPAGAVPRGRRTHSRTTTAAPARAGRARAGSRGGRTGGHGRSVSPQSQQAHQSHAAGAAIAAAESAATIERRHLDRVARRAVPPVVVTLPGVRHVRLVVSGVQPLAVPAVREHEHAAAAHRRRSWPARGRGTPPRRARRRPS